MNLYASSVVSSGVNKRLGSTDPPGALFKLGIGKESSQMLLLAESWSELPVKGADPLKHVAQAIVGFVGKPGQRFGGGTGLVWTDPPDATPDRFDVRASQVAFFLHRRESRHREDPRGAANFAFADGHVELLRTDELVDFATGKSRYRALWSPIDRDIE